MPYLEEFGKRTGLTAIRSKDANRLVDSLNALLNMTVVPGNENKFQVADGNAVLTIRDTSGSSSTTGWRWAEPIEYDNATDYSSGEVVLVSPDNTSIASCTAGLWVAITAVGSANFPLWDQVTPSEYWQLISFYPTILTVCDEGVDTDYYINAQPVP